MSGRKNPFFSWSPMREEMFHDCELCYLFHYYTAHKGWLSSSNVENRATYRWKKANKTGDLVSRGLIKGLLDGIYSDEKLSVKNIRTNVLEMINQSFHDSTRNKEKWYRQPNKVTMLYELVYEEELDEKLVKETTNTLDENLNNFLSTQLIRELSDKNSELINIRQHFRDGFTYFDFEKMDTRVYAGVQVVHKRSDGKVIATVFKTKKKPSTLSQVGAIAKVVADVLKEDINNIIVRDEYLIDGSFKSFMITDAFYEKTQLAIEDSINMMREFLVDGDIQKNEFVGFKKANYMRAYKHEKAGKEECTMDVCPYCEAVKRDLELYPNGYDSSVAILKYSKKVLRNLQTV